MPWPRSVRRNLLFESSKIFRLLNGLKKIKCGVHPINKIRSSYGESHHLYLQLRKFPDRFFQYLRMSIETFDALLAKAEDRIQKETTNWRRPISPEERLVVTINLIHNGQRGTR
jgi:hypothetical protein